MGWFCKAARLAGLIVGLSAVGTAAVAAPALWVVRDGDSEIYLFGALHALTPGAAWRTPAYDAAYARAETVWFEAELDDATPARITSLVDRYGIDPQRALSAKLPAPTRRALERQTDLARIEHLRPWAAALMLAMQPPRHRPGPATVEHGVDVTMTRVVVREAKTLQAFETLEDQARMFAALPEPAEVRYLSDVVAARTPRLRLNLRRGESLERAWLAGDLRRLAPDLLRKDNPALYEALLKRRNLAWADRLTQAMAGSGVALVNVGALHMLGDDGLPALMRARGYEVRRVQ